jgi:polyhydroxybutyrate depolymerase
MFTKKLLTASLSLAFAAALCSCSQDAPAQDDGGGRPTLRELLRQRMAQRHQGNDTEAQSGDIDEKITKPGDYTFSFDHDGITRKYLVHVPSQYDPAKPAPLLISMHGGGGNMDYQANDQNYGQITASNRYGFVVVFPNGYSRFGGKLATWNAGNCCGPARDKDVDDVGFIREMIDHLEHQLNIDPHKVFATGMSNGGLMAHRLACEMPGTIKAIAAVAATDNTKSCHPSQPVSVMEIHARNDDHLPFNGGMGAKSMRGAVTDFTSVPDSIARWVQRDHCPTPAKRVIDKPGAYCDRYAPCEGGTAVELCVTETGGHSWPGASRSRGSEPPSQAISANDVMWQFFMNQ